MILGVASQTKELQGKKNGLRGCGFGYQTLKHSNPQRTVQVAEPSLSFGPRGCPPAPEALWASPVISLCLSPLSSLQAKQDRRGKLDMGTAVGARLKEGALQGDRPAPSSLPWLYPSKHFYSFSPQYAVTEKQSRNSKIAKKGLGGERGWTWAHSSPGAAGSQRRCDFPSWAGRRSQHNVQSQRGQGASEVILWF